MSGKIYTRSGDDGTTGLVNGRRLHKSDVRIESYGTVDELNSQIGLLVAQMHQLGIFAVEEEVLTCIQHRLFNLGSLLACEADQREQYKLPLLSSAIIKKLEDEIDRMDLVIPPLSHFILPGGLVAAAQAHVCRSVCRRAERRLLHFKAQAPTEVPEYSEQFINRLSDYFFTLARYLNHQRGIKDIGWNKKYNGC